MRLPRDILSNNYTKPRVFLCEVDKTRICQLEVTNLRGSFKFNSYSDISFEVGRTYNNMITNEIMIHPYFDKIESPRLILLEGFGYFELQGPELISDGIKEIKSCTAYSYEYNLSTKYLEDFYINTGEVDSIEVINATSEDNIVPVTLYNPSNIGLSLLHLILKKDYAGWSVGHIDDSLKTLSRTFEVDRQSVYDFLMNEVAKKFNCYIIFDTTNNTINLYAESLTAKFIGDGTTNTFTISPPFKQIGTVSVDGYKTTRWIYNVSTGALKLTDIPNSGAHIEVVDGAFTTWETDVFITFDNLSQEININYDADSIKTVLNVSYGDDYDIRESNLGSSSMSDLSYYHTVDWMGQELYDAYTAYLQRCNTQQEQYTSNAQQMLKWAERIDYAENRLSLEYSVAIVDDQTVGTYYVRGGDADGGYYYTEVSLPTDYKVNETYYSTDTANLTEVKVSNLFEAIKKYFKEKFTNTDTNWEQAFNNLADDFQFMDIYEYDLDWLIGMLSSATTKANMESSIANFLNKMWNEIGKNPLQSLYQKPYKQVQITAIDAGWSNEEHDSYYSYYATVLLLASIDKAIDDRKELIGTYHRYYTQFQDANINIANMLSMRNNFTNGQLARLNAFLREDELHLSEIITTDQDSVTESFKAQQDAMESARIELQKISQPQLQFSMSMANIYALPEFTPIIDQFQLGKLIKVALRPDYMKQARLLQVNMNFDDFSDFSCDFGDLTDFKTQSDLHADLLAQAITAGKSVAANSSYWTKGSDQVNEIDLRLQEGLLNSIEALKALDGTQNAYMDKYGIHLEVVNPETGEVGDKRVWMVNNQIVFTDDGFKTSKAVLGEFTVDNESYYGLLAQAVISGYIEGSQIRGGKIQIGRQDDGTYAFEVLEDGSVKMNGGVSTNENYITANDVQNMLKGSMVTSDKQPSSPQNGQMWLDTSTNPYTLRMFNGASWVVFNQQEGGRIFTSRPATGTYSAGDMWILGKGEVYGNYSEGSILKANSSLSWVDATPEYTQWINNTKQYFDFSTSNGVTIGQKDEKFYVNISSTEMGFYDNSSGQRQKVVSISNNAATIQNATFKGSNGTIFNNYAKFNQQAEFEKQVDMMGFVWKKESNGSLSLVLN